MGTLNTIQSGKCKFYLFQSIQPFEIGSALRLEIEHSISLQKRTVDLVVYSVGVPRTILGVVWGHQNYMFGTYHQKLVPSQEYLIFHELKSGIQFQQTKFKSWNGLLFRIFRQPPVFMHMYLVIKTKQEIRRQRDQVQCNITVLD